VRFDAVCAVVSGGASGLGLAVTERVLARGGKVVVLDVQEEAGSALARRHASAVRFVATDVRDDEAVERALDESVTFFGHPPALAVSCAGILGAGRVLAREGPMPSARFRHVLEVNLLGTFHLARAAVARMSQAAPNEEGERGCLVFTASVAAFEGQIGQAAYSASKGGVASMTLPLAREFARVGVRVVTIAPGLFETPMMHGMPPEVQASLSAQVPFPSRLGRPAEYAALVESVVTNPMLNGCTLRLDGAIRLQPK
jgi:NAD(P)-dependent dehydrogenase (short-subunit alcohol dehydrogenase family)